MAIADEPAATSGAGAGAGAGMGAATGSAAAGGSSSATRSSSSGPSVKLSRAEQLTTIELKMEELRRQLGLNASSAARAGAGAGTSTSTRVRGQGHIPADPPAASSLALRTRRLRHHRAGPHVRGIGKLASQTTRKKARRRASATRDVMLKDEQ